jgi:ATP-dependent protease ClpP protease subunit
MRRASVPPRIDAFIKVAAKCVLAMVCGILLVATQAWAGAYEDGIAAYDQKKFEAAYALWLPLAERGHAAAQFNVAVLFEKGLGVAQDPQAAARWYLKAAEQGDAEAQYNVAARYEAGLGLPLDPGQARYWYGRVLANPHSDRATLEARRRARERLATLVPELSAQSEEIVAYDGGRFVIRPSATRDCVIAIQGVVTKDASIRFDDVFGKAAAIGCRQPLLLLLESPGGSLRDGIALGEEVHARKLRTVARYDCASACSIIFMGGAERVLVGSRARIGLHQPALVGEKDRRCDPTRDNPDTIRMKRYLRIAIGDEADRVFDIAMSTSCDAIEWVSGQRALELKIATKVESAGVDVFGPRNER